MCHMLPITAVSGVCNLLCLLGQPQGAVCRSASHYMAHTGKAGLCLARVLSPLTRLFSFLSGPGRYDSTQGDVCNVTLSPPGQPLDTGELLAVSLLGMVSVMLPCLRQVSRWTRVSCWPSVCSAWCRGSVAAPRLTSP